MNEAITIRPLLAAEDLSAIVTEARDDKHGVHVPTHVLEWQGRRIGYVSVNAIPIVTGWASRSVPDDRLPEILAAVEAVARESQLKLICLPTTEDCRFGPHLAACGYRRGKGATFNLKRLE